MMNDPDSNLDPFFRLPDPEDPKSKTYGPYRPESGTLLVKIAKYSV
jgi:hypothetical protein